MINFGKSVNSVVFPEYSESAVIKSLIQSAQDYRESEKAKRRTALDFYLYQNTERHVQQWFESDSLQQVPVFPQAVVQRFARARMMLYKNPCKRYIGNEINDDYNKMTYMLDSKIKMFSEIAWLLGDCFFKSSFNENKQRLEYTILPDVKEYCVIGESSPFGMSYEVESPFKNKRMFVYWSEDRDGVQGAHFKFDQDGKRYPVGDNSEMIIEADLVGEDTLTVSPKITTETESELNWFRACGLSTTLYYGGEEIELLLSECEYDSSISMLISQISLESIQFNMDGLDEGEYTLVFETTTAPMLQSSISFDWPILIDEIENSYLQILYPFVVSLGIYYLWWLL